MDRMAKLAKEFGRKGSLRSAEELETARKNEKRAMERFGRAMNAKIDAAEKNSIAGGPVA